jgi:hypothetical protein
LIGDSKEIRPRILMLAALFAIFPLMFSFMPLIGAALKGDLLMLAISCVIAGLGVSGLLFAFRDGSLLALCLFWVALLGVAAWMYPEVGLDSEEDNTSFFVIFCLYLMIGLGLTLAARPFRASQEPE